MKSEYDVLVVGAGHAGVQAATGLIKAGYPGSIGLISAEAHLPYERPPLSKAYLSGAHGLDELLVRSAEYWSSSPIELRLATTVTAVSPEEHRVVTDDGSTISYGSLVWATGVRPRTLPIPGAGLERVTVIRTLDDTDKVRVAAGTATNAVVIGAGYIGLEAAATLRKQGIAVVVVEAQDRVLKRVAGPEISAWFQRRHEREGVGFRLGAGVTAIEGDTHVTGVRLSDGELLPADLVLIGVGVAPAVETLEAAGATIDNGVLTDAEQRTSLVDVFAIGDCARSPHDHYAGELIRFESVPSAVEQANTVAAVLSGRPTTARQVPWFWSDQYDAKLKSVGLNTAADQQIVRGDVATDSFSVFYLSDGEVCAVDCVNRPRDFAVAKRLVAAAVRPDPALLGDDDLPLKSLLT